MRPIRSLKHEESVTVAFRVSKDDAELIKQSATLSGLSRQDYLRECVINREIKVVPNIRVRHYLEQYLVELRDELTGMENCPDELVKRIENVLEIVEKV